MADARSLFRGVSLVTASRVIGLVFTLAQVKLSVTYLQAGGYGLLTTATLFISAFGAWTELGLGAVVLRRVSGGKQDLEENVGWVMSISLVLIAPLLLVTNATGWVLYRDEPRLLLGIGILSIGLAATCWSSCYTPVAQVKNQFRWYAISDLASRMVSLTVVSLAVLYEASLAWFFVAQLMPPLVVLMCMELWGRRVGKFRPVWNRPAMLGLIRETLPMTYIFVVAVLYFTIDGILLSKLSTMEQVASYGLAYKIAGNLSILGSAVAAVMAARFAADAASSNAAFAATMRSTLRMMLLIAVPVAVFVWPLAPDVIRFVGSEEMVGLSSRPLAVVCVAVAIGMISLVVSTALLNAYQQKFLAKLSTVNLAINIVLNVILIPRYGALGAAIALIASELSGLLCCFALMARRFPGYFPVRAVLVLPICAAAGLGTEMLLREVPWFPRAMIVFAVFVGAALVTRAVSLAEIRLVAPWGKRAAVAEKAEHGATPSS